MVSTGFLLLGVVLCAVGVFIIHKVSPVWFREVRLSLSLFFDH